MLFKLSFRYDILLHFFIFTIFLFFISNNHAITHTDLIHYLQLILAWWDICFRFIFWIF